ncbi:hypothetical protein Acid345_3405 [Candidatus Koribacter versatilis Ellin345]|uniref:DUF3486 family protein n=1 Tax=Koribacter versatilis (strain Ellin345) TaxID=204669 RepID=Q1IL44_KORVE|nr:hypothetical protein [Candidatus Koribacter versatilis]ABF42406.1 hypothetical protein Acid345_3405 [Candidatus Koribacter versatilis Ellin345]
MAARRKTGEKPRVRQPLKIDQLSAEMLKRIQDERANFRTWKQIEEDSPKWDEWSTVKADVIELFPDLRLPHSNLQRWYDIRIDQVRQENLAETEKAREFASAFRDREFSGLDEAVMNAIRDQVFSLMKTAGPKDQANFLDALVEFGHLVAKFKRIELGKEKVGLERERLSLVATKIRGLKDEVQKKQLTSEDLQARLDEMYGITAA